MPSTKTAKKLVTKKATKRVAKISARLTAERNKPADSLSMKEMPDFYTIKYRAKKGSEGIHFGDGRDLTKWQYGIQVRFDDDVEKLWKAKKHLVVEDAIGPKTYVVDPHHFEIVPLEHSWNPKGEYDQYVDDEHIKAIKKHNAAKTLVDKIITMGVADGCAYYVVTGETKNKVTIEWRGFCLDRWTDRVLGYGGKFPKSMVAHLVEGKFNLKTFRF
jgi:hypothetical protein